MGQLVLVHIGASQNTQFVGVMIGSRGDWKPGTMDRQMKTYLDSQCAHNSNHIDGTVNNAVVRQSWIVLPDGGCCSDSRDFCDFTHERNIAEVDDMTETAKIRIR